MVKLKTWFQSRAVQFHFFHHRFLNKVNVVLSKYTIVGTDIFAVIYLL